MTAPAYRITLNPVSATNDPAAWLSGDTLDTIADMVLPAYLGRQRWYGSKDAGPPRVSLAETVPFPAEGITAVLAIWQVEPPGRTAQRYFLPLAVVPPGIVEAGDASVLAGAHPENGGWLVIDSFAADAFVRAFVGAMLEDGGTERDPRLLTGWTGVAAADALPVGAAWPIRRGSAEQSNTSIRVGESAILKVFRRLEEGIHPELEMGRFLTEEAGFPAIPALLGWAEVQGGGGKSSTLGVLQQFVANEGDGWSWVLDHLGGDAPDPDRKAVTWLAQLGSRTAEMHRALAVETDDPAFRPEPVTAEDRRNWTEAAREMARRALDGLAGAENLPEQVRKIADSLVARREEVMERIAALLPEVPVHKTRHHGDYHLGQVLVPKGAQDAIIVDFEGEPLRPLAERRAKHSPLRDVAGMLRSFSYAAAVAARESGGETDADALTRWSHDASKAYLDAYLAGSQGCPGCGPSAEDTIRLVRFFMLEKALYEVVYELANRPDWVAIPLGSVVALLEEGGQAAGASAGPVRRAHQMPFGAEVQADGRVRFRLWAPKHPAIQVAIEGGETLPLVARDEGWHELVTDRAKAGGRYSFVLPDGMKVPDPASRFQPEDVHGPSEIIAPAAYEWRDADWQGRPWEEAVVYELHLGAFTPEGTFRAAIKKLDHLVDLGVTTLEIMPVADFPGRRNWGYDGVLPYAPDGAYGRPEDFKALVDAAHARGLMVMLDVVYNHFGPEGNYLPLLGPIFNEQHHTPWGGAVNVDGPGSPAVREYIIHNALYWIEEFHLDGLRLDAVHAIMDDSSRHLLDDLAERARTLAGSRHIHLVLENEENQASRLERDEQGRPRTFTAQWNDDVHHGLHVAASGESAGYYVEYHGDLEKLARALAEGFTFQGEMMEYRGEPRGEPSGHLPPGAFVAFLQNHDQIGNRAFGDRITAANPAEAVKAAASLYLLSPQVPMLFMGEEWAAAQPFPFFADFGPDLANAVREGRRKEFERFPEFKDPEARERIPDPTAEGTFTSAKLAWDDRTKTPHAEWLDWYRSALKVRRAEIVPRLRDIKGNAGSYELVGKAGIVVRWRMGDGSTLAVAANLSAEPAEGFPEPAGRVIWSVGEATGGRFGPWAVHWHLEEGGGGSGKQQEQASTPLDQLAARCGIEPGFKNAMGEQVTTSADTKRQLLSAMGIQADSEEQARSALEELDRKEWGRPLPPVQVVRADGEMRVEITLPSGARDIGWRLALEEGGERTGQSSFDSLALVDRRDLDGQAVERRALTLPPDLPWGYHRLELDSGASTTLIVAPKACWLPPTIEQGGKLWGVSAQLYLLRSASNWGIGDFTDLRTLVERTAERGADVIGLNPLHVMFPDNPAHASPYSPASRLLLNILNIDVTALPEFASCTEAQEIAGSEESRTRLESCRAAKLVNYEAVADLKMQVLGALFESCRSANPERWQAFQTYRGKQTEAWERSCLFLVMRQHFAEHGPGPDWHDWPEEYRDVGSDAVQRFAREHSHKTDFMAWLQWIADEQLAAAAEAAQAAGMEIGLYRDLAVGADRAGAETWVNPSAMVSDAQVGAPPDIFNPAGQNWGLPPFDPRALREEGYRGFIELVRANMRHAGGLRIDHVMSLQHLYWIPQGAEATDGAYVAYPMDDMVGILALESQRHGCLVVGEDLGTVPEGFRERMAEANILSYRVLFFEQDGETGAFATPDDYPRLALAVVGSHDLPTLSGWWEGNDIPLKERLGLYPSKDEAEKQRTRRGRDRSQLLEAFRNEKLLKDGEEIDDSRLAEAAHAFLARSEAALAMVQIDDLTAESDPVNVPATSTEHPNWRRRLSIPLEELPRNQRFNSVCEVIHAARGEGEMTTNV
ncbi:malto-oligosyltrehalose trehalohydrolase [Indioceanicola profundi]|uniref:malto-oligosyltrehalose trehalohydrolase n=1 Tax=Indioceanicola profundi TaxID=2220096 RepID=UPI000E6AAF56|nr:malto-oligosyltrehalose trehalohydrolase [Indioceanicola profundi]